MDVLQKLSDHVDLEIQQTDVKSRDRCEARREKTDVSHLRESSPLTAQPYDTFTTLRR